MATPTSLPASFVSQAVLTAAQMNNLRGAFRILQVVSTFKSDTFSTNSTTFTDITGLSVSITPSATSSLVLVSMVANTASAGSGVNNAHLQLVRGSTAIALGDAAGSRTRATIAGLDSIVALPYGFQFLDSPSTTSATTYKVQIRSNVAAQNVFINRSATDGDNAANARIPSSITVMEISA